MKLRDLIRKKEKAPEDLKAVIKPKGQILWEQVLQTARAKKQDAEDSIEVQSEVINLAIRKIQEIQQGFMTIDKKDIKGVSNETKKD